MKHKFEKNWWKFPIPAWQEFLIDLDKDYKGGALIWFMEDGYVTHAIQKLPKIQRMLDYILSLNPQYISSDAHAYMSILSSCPGIGPHIDYKDVYYIQGIGKTHWVITEDDKDYEYVLELSDMIFIPKETKHCVKPLTPRIGISLGFA